MVRPKQIAQEGASDTDLLVWNNTAGTWEPGTHTLQEAYDDGASIVTDVGGGAFDVSGTQAISLDASAASNFTVAGANLTLSTTTSGTVAINSAGAVDIDGSSLTLDTTGGFSLDAGAISNITVANDDLTVSTTGAGGLNLSSANNAILSGATLDIDATTTMTIDGGTSVSINTGADNTTTIGRNVATETAAVAINTGTGGFTVVAGTANASIGGAISMTSKGKLSDFTAIQGGLDGSSPVLTLETQGSSADLLVNAGRNLELTAAASVVVDAVSLTVGDGTGAEEIVIDKDGASTGRITFQNDSSSTTGAGRINHSTAENISLEYYYSAAFRNAISGNTTTGEVLVSSSAVDHDTTIGGTTGGSKLALRGGTESVTVETDGVSNPATIITIEAQTTAGGTNFINLLDIVNNGDGQIIEFYGTGSTSTGDAIGRHMSRMYYKSGGTISSSNFLDSTTRTAGTTTGWTIGFGAASGNTTRLAYSGATSTTINWTFYIVVKNYTA